MGEHVCPWWLAYAIDNPLRLIFHNPAKILGPYVKKGMTVLDVGCGMGFFSIGLARLVSDSGCVIAADVQPKMLKTLKKRSKKAGVADTICFHRCQTGQLGIDTPVEFILAFWMVHEVPDLQVFFHQIRACLKPTGKMLIAEPRFHVSPRRFQEILGSARACGLNSFDTPSIRFSRSAVLSNTVP